MDTTLPMVGVGLRSAHYPKLETNLKTEVDWFEAISENYMNTEGRPLQVLLHVRSAYPVALHGVGLSIASSEGASLTYLKKLKTLIQRVDPIIVSDHFCWSRHGGHYSHDLLPFPLNLESLNKICENVEKVQEFLNRQICLENISYYLKSSADEMTEASLINEVCKKTGCGLLLDLNNIQVNAANFGLDAFDYLRDINLSNVKQIHLAGPSQEEGFVFDTHSTPIPESVWELYMHISKTRPDIPVIVEWDENIPAFEALEHEAQKARKIFTTARSTQ